MDGVLGGSGGIEVLSDFNASAAWVTDGKGRVTGRPQWAIDRGWQVFQIPDSSYNGPNVDQFDVPSAGAYVLRVRVKDSSYPDRILIYGKNDTGPRTAASFFLSTPLRGATLTLRFAAGDRLSHLLLRVDRRSDGTVDQTLAPTGLVKNRSAIESDNEGPKIVVTARPMSPARSRVTVTAVGPVGVAAVYYAIGKRPLHAYSGPFVAPSDSRLFVMAGDALGNGAFAQGRVATFRRKS